MDATSGTCNALGSLDVATIAVNPFMDGQYYKTAVYCAVFILMLDSTSILFHLDQHNILW